MVDIQLARLRPFHRFRRMGEIRATALGEVLAQANGKAALTGKGATASGLAGKRGSGNEGTVALQVRRPQVRGKTVR